MSDDKPEEESDYDVESDQNDDIYNTLALGEDDNKREDKEVPISDYDDIDIDIETTAMEESVNKILELDEDLPKNAKASDGFLNIKTVNSNSGEMDGLEPCTKYSLEVTAVYNNNATAASEQKRFNTECKSGTPCDQDEWQESL